MPSATKKFLDKQGIKWYNIRREGKEKGSPLTIRFMEMIDRYENGDHAAKDYKYAASYNVSHTAAAKQKIIEVGNAVREVSEIFMPGSRPPVIAGGAVRDMFFGLTPKDYDVFFDVTSITDEDERDDFVLLFADAVRNKMAATTEPNLEFTRLRSVGLGGSYRGEQQNDGRTQNWGTGGKFFVYETWPDDAWNDRVNEEIDRANAEGRLMEEEEFAHPLRVQLIGHVDQNLSANVPAFIEGFDYGLVKCWYDPQSEEFVFSDAFKEVLKTQVINYKGIQTGQRVANWIDRWYWELSNGGEKLPCPFKPVNQDPVDTWSNYYGSKAKKSKYSIPPIDPGLMRVAADNFIAQAQNANGNNLAELGNQPWLQRDLNDPLRFIND